MSNQLQITGGAKVRNLEGVLTGTSGVVSSLGINVPSGIPQLDGSGKILVSQLPNSVMEYKGTWNAATNTPTLADGTGNQGDVYLCNVAGTTNFGSGPITFAVGDQVIYSGTIWQKASGATGTVTSVAVTSTGNDAISITGSPITTAGTINIGFTGTSAQYVNGAGDLTTFPSLTGYVPYTGATTDVDLGVHVLNAQALHVKGTAGAGHLGLKHQSAAATGSANESLIYANVDGDLAWQNDNLYLTTLSTHANTANRVYTFPDLSGTIALLEGTQTISGAKTFSAGVTISNTGNQPLKLADYATSITTTTGYTTIGTNANGFQIVNGGGKGANFFFGSSTYAYYLPSSNGTLALTSDIPSLTGYVPYTGATSDVNLGYRGISASNINIDGYSFGDGGAINFKQFTSLSLAGTGYTSIGANSTNILTFGFNQGSLNLKGFKLDVAGLTTNVWRTYTMPNASGTLALTSDIPSLANYVTLTGTQTITGVKTFTNEQLFGNGMTLTGGYITYTSGSFNLTLNTNLLTANRNVFLQDKAGTIALTSDLTGGTVTSVGLSSATSGVTIGSSPVTTSGTITLAIATASGSQQGLLSSTDWTTFNNKQNALTNPVTGTGTSSYHAKFTGTSTIGNSMLTDDGTTLQSIGATRSNLYLKAASSSYYSQLAFTNGTNGSFGGISYNNSGQYMQFETNSSEWMRLTSTGNLGIGTTSPTGTYGRLSVAGGISILDDNNAKLEIGRYSSGASNSYIKLGANSNSLRITNNTDSADIFTILNDGSVGVGPNGANSVSSFITAGVGTSSAKYSFIATNNAGSTLLAARNDGLISTGSQALSPYNLTYGGAANLYVNALGELYRATSSLKYKTDIIDYDKGLDIIKQLRPVYYKSKNDENTQYAGFIAEEVHDLGLTEFVQYAEDKTPDALAYSHMVALLTKAIQEQQELINNLSAKVTALENK